MSISQIQQQEQLKIQNLEEHRRDPQNAQQNQHMVYGDNQQTLSDLDNFGKDKQSYQTVINVKRRKKNCIIVLGTLLMILFGAKILIDSSNNKETSEYMTRTDSMLQQQTKINGIFIPEQKELRLPKILWLYTQNPLEGEKMLEQVMSHYLIHVANQSGWEVKTVNSWSAYGHLNPDTQMKITDTMQRMYLEEKVHDLYKLGLLIDKGGVVISPTELLPIENFSWIENFFMSTQEELEHFKATKVLLFQKFSHSKTVYEIQDFFIAAAKGSILIRDTFNEVCQSITTGNLTFFQVKRKACHNKEMNSIVVEKLLINTLSAYINIFGSMHYSVKILSLPSENTWCQANKTKFLKKNKNQFNNICGEPSYFIHLPNNTQREALENQMEKMIDEERISFSKDSYMADLMSIPYNRQLYERVEQRAVHYCLFDSDPSQNFEAIKESVKELEKQDYSQWTAVYYLNQTTDEHKTYTQEMKQQGFNIIIEESTGSIGRNIEYGIIKLCPNKSFVLILKTHERLAATDSLTKLVQKIQPRDVLGSFVMLNISGTLSKNEEEYQNYNKYEFNGLNPKVPDLEKIKNHLRVFHSDCFKIIPQFELVTPRGEYYDDRFVFYEIFLRMVIRYHGESDTVEYPHVQKTKWLLKSSRHIFDVPFRIKFFNDQPLINTDALETINMTQIELTKHKDNAYSMMESMDHLLQNGQTMEEFAIMNPGNKFEGYIDRNKQKERIPKIIHQIWVGDKEMNEGKKAIRAINKGLYPNFEHRLWTSKDITRENFPLSYDLIQTLMKADKFTRYSKMASVADVMRHQILYQHGGFYMDTSMYLFNDVFNQLLSYKVVISTLNPFKHRWIQSMCFFANEPKYPGLLRIISHYNTNRYNVYERDAMRMAGPYDFRHYIKGQQEYDPDILIMAFEYFFPMEYGIAYGYVQAFCAVAPHYVHEGDEKILWINHRWLIKDCGKYYPHLYGKETSVIGGSTWQLPRWEKKE